MFGIIRSPRAPDNWNEKVGGSHYLYNTGVGDDIIFNSDDRTDDVMNYDGEENVDLDKAETREVYLYKQASGDHHMF